MELFKFNFPPLQRFEEECEPKVICFLKFVFQTIRLQLTPASSWWPPESVSRRGRAGWTSFRETSTSLSTSSPRLSDTALTASSLLFPIQVQPTTQLFFIYVLRHEVLQYSPFNTINLSLSLFLWQSIYWLMWPGNWAGFPSTVSSAAAPTWTRHASVSWWPTNWESTRAASMDGSWESMETQVVRIL